MKTQNSLMSELQHSVDGLLQHKLNLLEGSKLRVQSIESRAQNVINLVSPSISWLGMLKLKALLGFQYRQPT